ncbi:MAG: hypothetical protein DMG65_06525 [Candidatus Angelobacter sp. Gp1-AA117]|nr:MAG: hypothetical protein DMG65_06525 [Candidatus Angelobacter sp. Gp1-AA117]
MTAVKKMEFEILLEGKATPSKVVIECDSDLAASLVDCISEKFHVTEQHEFLPSLAGFAEPLRGRPMDAEVQNVGFAAAKLHEKHSRISWLQIAMRVCPLKQNDARHRCTKKCADRTRQAAKSYLKAQQSR